MKRLLEKTGALMGPLLLLCCVALAQDEVQIPERQQLDTALAIEHPSARIEALERFLAQHPNSPYTTTAQEGIVTSWAQLAEGQLVEKNLDRALFYFRKALAALPQKVSDRFFEETLARIPLAISVRGYRNEAVEMARQLEPQLATQAKQLGALGEFYMSVEAPIEAMRVLEAATKLMPDDARLRRILSSAYRMGLRLDDAIAELQLAIGLDPQDKRAYYELANLYRSYGEYKDAIKLYRKQLEIDPKHVASVKGLALTYLAQGREELAAVELDNARNLAGSEQELTRDLHFQTQIAFHYLTQGQIEQAQKAVEQALVVEPRYSWARIAAAEVDLAQGRYFEAERHLLAALQYADFPTLRFILGKLYLTVESFDDALEQFAKAFTYTQEGKFRSRLGGVLEVQATGVGDLLSREHQSALFLFELPASEKSFRLAENLVRLDACLREAKAARTRAEDPAKLEKAALDFIEADSARQAFRALYVAQRLAHSGRALELAVKLAEQAFDAAEVATEADGSLRDYPNFDREGRLRIFRGRAADAKGWALLKLGRIQEAIAALSIAVETYGKLPEHKRALWHLAAAKETAGELNEALELFLAGYEPPALPSRGSDVNRAIIEVLYRKIHGSLQGLEARIGRPPAISGAGLIAASRSPRPATDHSGTPVVGKDTQTEITESELKKTASHFSSQPLTAVTLPRLTASSFSLPLPKSFPESNLSWPSALTEALADAPPPGRPSTLPRIDQERIYPPLLRDQIATFLASDPFAEMLKRLAQYLESARSAPTIKSETLAAPPPTTSSRPRRVTATENDQKVPPEQETAKPPIHTRKRRVTG